MRVDLHIHTVASDGCWTPEQVVAEVRKRDIGLFAVADHDSIASVGPTEKLACEHGLAFLHGVEVSSLLDGELFHILAYGFDLDDVGLSALLHDNRILLDQNNDRVIGQLIDAGYAIDFETFAAYDYDRRRGGWKALNFLIDQGLCTGTCDYFDDLLEGVSTQWPQFPYPADVIAAIREAGGVPILAHPGASLRHVGLSDESLRPFLDFGIAGLECYSQYHDEATTRDCLDWCERHGLLITGGSDCHGGFVEREVGNPAVEITSLRLGELEQRLIR